MNNIIYLILGLLVYAVIWFAISSTAYLISSLTKNKLALGAIIGISTIANVILSLFMGIWFLYTTYHLIFIDKSILLGLLFFFILGGFIIGIYTAILGFFTAIPLFFYDKLENELEKQNIGSGFSTDEAQNDESLVQGELRHRAEDLVKSRGKASTALFQKELQVDYVTAVNIMNELERSGLVGKADGLNPRKVNL